ncbi:hypothetical protein P0136_08895 [Lentisphaerota bacterium ZTH]|nr:hypothetical protein JYG24_13595 [Lentisphaerota bacterium]WET05480.1 hypothetical protein P0136_08895 [Lentisphaerota bacterium ZTH]
MKRKEEFIQDAVLKTATEIIARNPDYLKSTNEASIDGLVNFFSKLYDKTQGSESQDDESKDDSVYNQLSERIC